MDNHNLHPLSESEQMYLLRIAMLAEDGTPPPIPLAALAEALAIQQVSANQMVRKLDDAGLVTYTPYKGVALTFTGQAVAVRMLRYRRLWEVFLVDKLGMSAEAADLLACRLEHLTSEDVANRLAHFLGDPQKSPRNKPIPQPDAPSDDAAWLSLSLAPFAQPLQVMRVQSDPVTRTFLADEGVSPGGVVSILAAGADGSLLLDVAGQSVRLQSAIAGLVFVHPYRSLS